MNITQLREFAFRKVSKASIVLNKFSPEILLFLGITLGAGTVVLAARAEKERSKIVKEHEATMRQLEEDKLEAGENMNQTEHAKAAFRIYSRTGLALGKLYAPTLMAAGSSLACILASHNIIHGRHVATVAAYNAVATSFAGYRKRVLSRVGEEVEKQIFLDIEPNYEEEQVDDPNKPGKKKKVKVQKGYKTGSVETSPYSRFFDELNPNFKRQRDMNRFFLSNMQKWANERLQAKGYLFLNEVYEALGYPQTPAGQVVGWLSDGDGDNYVDFGIYDVERNPSVTEFVNGTNPTILLDFNVDGEIWEKI